MSRAAMSALAAVVVVFNIAPVVAQQPTGGGAETILCPVTGDPIDRECVTRFRGHWVYFANEDAKTRFAGDPYEYAEGVKAQWDVDKPLRVQVKCPITGKPPAAEIYTGEGLTAVFFATAEARDKWATLKHQEQMDAVKDCYSYQTGCATCGMPIDVRIKREIDGQSLYFCCEGCVAGFAKNNPDKLREIERTTRSNEAAWKQLLTELNAKKKPKPQAEPNKRK